MRGVDVAGGPKHLQWGGWVLTLRGGCQVYGKAGPAKASGPGCTALYGVGVGVPSPEPVLFSLRQSSGLLRPLGQ